MAKHEVSYDRDGLSLDDPWTLNDYLHEDGFSPSECEKIEESVVSWLREYETAGVDLELALGDLVRSTGAEPA